MSSPDVSIQAYLQSIDDWTDAWGAELHIRGRQFIIMQMPEATSPYSLKGVTLLYDMRIKQWMFLYGWNTDIGVPDRWPGWSVHQLWDRHFVGGVGEVLELDRATYQNNGVIQRMLFRSGHIDKWGDVEIIDIRCRLKRGASDTDSNLADDDIPQIRFRCLKDRKRWTRWKSVRLGREGDTDNYVRLGGVGAASTFQFELEVTDAVDLDVIKLQVLTEPRSW